MIYERFSIQRFRGIGDVSISLTRGDLVLLLGLNESGKTTILRGIEAFDFRNDPRDNEAWNAFLNSVRNKSDIHTNEPAVITATIRLDGTTPAKHFTPMFRGLSEEMATQHLFEAFWADANEDSKILIQRKFLFKNGEPDGPVYGFETDHPFAKHIQIASIIAREIINLCPFIVYFEDFTDRIPERIMVSDKSDAFNADWYDIIDGLFHNTDDKLSVAGFVKYFSPKRPRRDDAKTAMKRVNKKLNEVFTRKWQALSGVEDIAETELVERFDKRPRYFEIRVTDTDGTTYTVDERSKGALWYLSFLMKTEFRRKKMRKDSGRPIFLIDEPASNLHSSAQQQMVGDFIKLVEDTSVVYTTHSQYLISLANIRNAHVVRRRKGDVSATRWGDFLREDPTQVSHFQPLANLLQLIPNNLDVPWSTAVITEGPSDKNVLELMHQVLYQQSPRFVIYPGTNAYNLGTLISLNIGWNADFRVVLDGDPDGVEARDRYLQEHELDPLDVICLSGKRRSRDISANPNGRSCSVWRLTRLPVAR